MVGKDILVEGIMNYLGWFIFNFHVISQHILGIG